MRKVMLSCLACIIPMFVFAQSGPSPLQLTYVIKKVFPETQDISVFLEKNTVNDLKKKFNQAGVSNNIKIKLYPISSATDIGRSIKKIPQNGTLIVMNSDVLVENKSKLYILSKCKERNIKLVTSSQEYVDSGALLGVLMDETNSIQTIVNLKHSPQLKSKFTTTFIEQAGIAAVIEN